MNAIDFQYITLELVWKDSLGRCLTVEGGHNRTGTPVILEQCRPSNEAQRFSLGSGFVRWEQYPHLCLSMQRVNRHRAGILTQLCDSQDKAQLWVLQGSSPHPLLDPALCIEGEPQQGARAGLVPCASTAAGCLPMAVPPLRGLPVRGGG